MLRRIGVACVVGILIVVALSAGLTAASPTSQTLKDLSNGFSAYLKDLGVNPKTLSADQANTMFQQFLAAEPDYAALVATYDSQRSPRQPDVDGRTFEVASLGPVVETYDLTVNGTTYTVTVQEGTLTDGTPFVKVFSTGPDGVPDPYVMVTRTYLTMPVLWWTVTYGEDDWLYEQFLTNVGGVNEALAFKTAVNANLIGVMALGGILGPVASALVALAVTALFPAGLIVTVLDAYTVGIMQNTLNAAYDSTHGLYLAVHNRYLYTQLGSGIVIWAWYWFNSSWAMLYPAPPLYFEALSGTDSYFISNAFNSIGNKYGFGQWVWAGVYR